MPALVSCRRLSSFIFLIAAIAAYLASVLPASAYRLTGTVKVEMKFESTKYPGAAVITTKTGQTIVTAYKKLAKTTATYQISAYYPSSNIIGANPGRPSKVSTLIEYEMTEETQTQSDHMEQCRIPPITTHDSIEQRTKWTKKYNGEGLNLNDPSSLFGITPLNPEPSLPIDINASGDIEIKLKFQLAGVTSKTALTTNTNEWSYHGSVCNQSVQDGKKVDVNDSMRASAQVLSFEIPYTLKRPLTSDLSIKRVFRGSFDPREFKLINIEFPDWKIANLEIDLAITDFPVASGRLDSEKPKRSEPVKFDASPSKGDFTLAEWTFASDDRTSRKCRFPGDRELEKRDTLPPFVKVLNPEQPLNEAYEKRPLSVAASPRELVFSSPLLCPLVARLNVSDGVFTSNWETQVDVEARLWRASHKHLPSTTQLAQPNEIVPPDHFSNVDGKGVKAVAQTVSILCLVRDVFYGMRACADQFGIDEEMQAHLLSKLKLGLVSTGTDATDASIMSQAGPLVSQIALIRSAGPFSGMFFVREVPEAALAMVAVLSKSMSSPEFREANRIPTNKPLEETGFFKCVALHESLHSLLLSLEHGAASSEFNTPSGVKDPKTDEELIRKFQIAKVIEHMYDRSIFDLMVRVLAAIEIYLDRTARMDHEAAIRSNPKLFDSLREIGLVPDVPAACRKSCAYMGPDGLSRYPGIWESEADAAVSRPPACRF